MIDTMDLPDSADEPALRRVKTVARLLDEAVRVPGTDMWVGLDPVLGVVPGAGDVLSAGLSLYIVAEAAYLGVPLSTVVSMLANVTVDVAGGTLPVVGAVFDTFWKANAWNVELIEEHLSDAGGPGADEPVTIDIEDA